jgi:hypothetical protein
VKAVLHARYEPGDFLEFKDVDKPAPKDNEILELAGEVKSR